MDILRPNACVIITGDLVMNNACLHKQVRTNRIYTDRPLWYHLTLTVKHQPNC